ncbi:BspA family leucine-rich repeat surface protein [Enterococcus faecium]
MEIKKFVIGTMTITCLLGPAALSSYAEEYSNKDTISEQSSKTSCQINKEVKESLENNNQTNKHEKNFDVGVQDGWKYSIQQGYAVLVGYSGSQTNITVPGEIKGSQTLIDLSNFSKYFNDISNVKNIKFVKTNGKCSIPGKISSDSWGGNSVAYDSSFSFEKFKNLETFDARGLDTSKITSLRECFFAVRNLNTVNFDDCNVSNVVDIAYMFSECTSLKSASFKNWNTSKVEYIQQMFYKTASLETIDISSFQTPNIKHADYTFCESGAKIIRLDNATLSRASLVRGMFEARSVDKELLVITRDSNLLNNRQTYLYQREPLSTPVLDANGGQFSDQTQTKKYFEKCVYEPEKLNLDNFERFKQENQPTRSGNNHFIEWKPSKEVSNIKNVLDLVGVTYVAQWVQSDWNFQWDSSDNYYKLTEYIGTNRDIVVPNEILGKPTKINLSSAFPLKNLGGSSPWTNVTSVRFSNNNGKKVKAIGNKIWFNSWSNMTEFDGSGLDTSNITDLEKTFENCSKLNRINISGWNTSNVTTMFDMFAKCSSLETIDIKNWNTSQLTNMQGLFYQCTNLKNIDLGSWNTEHVTNMIGIFNQCSSLNSVNIKNFNTKKVNSMQDMFRKCDNLKIIDLSSFVLNNNTDTNGMFFTSTDMELLVLTTDNTLKTLNYQDKFHRIPLHGPILDANGGQFSDNTVIKKYFDHCAYEPTKIELSEFEKFKNENQPSNNGFAHDFLGWQKEGTGSGNPSTVLDILENTYKAQWENVNWEFEENDSRILLTKYKGDSNEVVVPTNFNGKQIVLRDINTTIIPTRVQKFTVDKSGPYKLIIEDSNLNFGFDGNKNLQEVDFSGIDMSNITHMGVMFRGCSNLVKANFSECDFKKLTTMEYMFQDCNKLEEVNFENVNTPVLTDTRYMFFRCIKLNVIDLRSFTLNNNLNDLGMFTTDEKTELLVLTNNEKFQNIDFNKRFNRIPLSGPTFKANGGKFKNGEKEKRYFEKCAYTPDIIQMNKFNEFKSNLTPVREEFATQFLGWEAEQSEPQTVDSVLDLRNIVYKATWEDPNWNFTETDKTITLKSYKGTSNEINIPTFANGKTFIIDSHKLNFPSTATKIICKSDLSGKKVSYQSEAMSGFFKDLSHLVEVDLTGFDVSKVKYMNGLFWKCNSLTKVNLTNWTPSNVKRMDGLFYECNNLPSIDLSSWKTPNIERIDSMFYNCSKLKNININNLNVQNVIRMDEMFTNVPVEILDLSNWKTPRLSDTYRMFFGCSNLKLIKMNNFDMSNVTRNTNMFYRSAFSKTLVVTKDKMLLENYNFKKSDNTKPIDTPSLNANGGIFEDGQKIKSYFENVAVHPDELQISKFEEFKKSHIPIKENFIFRGWKEITNSKSSDEGILDIFDKTYMAVWKNMVCNTTIDNRKLNTTGNIGLVYIPNKFSVPKTKLNDSGEQIISFNKDDSLNIGVRDLSQSNSSWSLTGRLEWINKEIPGAYIQVESNQNSIKKNINDNTNPFDSSRDLINAEEEVRPTQSDNGYLKITNNSTNKLMEANSKKTHDNIYDYDLGNASLVIPDTKYIQSGEYTANVEWNLTNAPQ